MVNNTVLILNSASVPSADKDLALGVVHFKLTTPLRFEAKSPSIALNHFSFVNFFLNISASIGNNKFYYIDNNAAPITYTITISDGSYSIESLNMFITNELASAGHTGLFEILPDYSQNKAYIKWGSALSGWYINFGALSPYTLLGFTLNQNVPAGLSNAVNEINYAGTAAAFNNVESINVKTNLGSNMYLGSTQSSVLYQATPTVSVGSTQHNEPHNLLWNQSDSLSSGISEIIINLTDQNDAALHMSENFTVVLQIKT